VKPRFIGLVGTLFIAFAAFSLMMRFIGGDELTLIPWEVALVVIAIGAFLVKHGTVGAWTAGGSKEKNA
jgi:hypothetical protein